MAALLAVVAYQYKTIAELIEAENWVAHTHEVVGEMEGAFSGLQEAESGARGFVATGSDDHLVQFDDGLKRAEEHLAAARILTSDNAAQQSNLDRWTSLFAAKQAAMRHLMEVRRGQGAAAASEDMRTGEGLRLMTEIRALTGAMERRENSLLLVRQAAVRSDARKAPLAILFGSILALGLTLVAGWVSRRDTMQRQRTEEQFRGLLESAPDAMVIVNQRGAIVLVNAQTESLTGYTRDELIGQTVEVLIPERFRNKHVGNRMDFFRQPAARPMGQNLDLYCRRKDGTEFPVEISLSTLKDDGILVSAAIRDVTERKKAEAARQESETAFRTLAETVPQIVWMCMPDGLNVYFNQRWVDYTGLSMEESYGRGWNTPFHPDDKQPAWDAWNHAVATGGDYEIECRLRAVDRSYRWFLTKGVPLRDESGRVLKWFGTCTDIHELKEAEESPRGMAMHDDLTGLHNRRGFMLLAEQQLKVSKRTGSPCLLIFLDIDHLKHINDTLGHAAGSRAIIETAAILRSSFRHCDILARFGGDEFVILATDTAMASESVLRAHLRQGLEEVNAQPNRRYRLEFSIGAASIERDAQSSLDDLLARADALMYQDKRSKELSVIPGRSL